MNKYLLIIMLLIGGICLSLNVSAFSNNLFYNDASIGNLTFERNLTCYKSNASNTICDTLVGSYSSSGLSTNRAYDTDFSTNESISWPVGMGIRYLYSNYYLPKDIDQLYSRFKTNLTGDVYINQTNCILPSGNYGSTTSFIFRLAALKGFDPADKHDFWPDSCTSSGTAIVNSTYDNQNIEYSDNALLIYNKKNNFTRYLQVPQNVYMINAKMNLSNLNMSSNLTQLNLSINNKQIFYSNSLNITNNRTNNFASIIDNYLSTCVYVGGYCYVPILFKTYNPSNINWSILQYSDLSFDNYGIIENSQTYNLNAYETQQQNFSINISYDSNYYTLSNAYLTYNGTSYLGTSQLSTNNAIASKSLYVPNGVGNKTFYWTFGLTNSSGTIAYYNSTFYNQTVSLLNMSICGASPYNVPFINFTFHNDTLGNEAVRSIFVSDFVYWLSDATVNKTYSFSSATENSSYAFCFTPNNTIVNLLSSGYYDNSYSVQRNFENISLLTNSTTTLDLLLLPTSAGSYISFIIQNSYQQRIENALISMTKSSDGAFVDAKYTDGTGIATFFLDPNVNYIVSVTASGYDDFASSVTPSASPVTYTLTTSSSGSGSSSPMEGIDIIITPSGNQLNNDTTYTFSFNISSTKDFDSYGFVLWNSTTQLDSRSGSTIHGSYLSTTLSTTNQTYIIMRYYYVIDGTITNASFSWYVTNTEGSDLSIAALLTDLNNFIGTNSSGLFGIRRGTVNGDFTFAILIFLVTFFIAGVFTYKYGITGITSTMFLIFAVVLFLDVGANLIPPITNAVPHFVTIITGFVAIGAFIRELL